MSKSAKQSKTKATAMTTSASVKQERYPKPKEDDRSASEIAKQIKANSKSGDPFEFSDVDKGRQIFKLLPDGQYTMQDGEQIVRITRI